MGIMVIPLEKTELVERIVSNPVLDSAYEQVCKARKKYCVNSDIWDLRQNRRREKEKIRDAVKNGEYKFDAVRVIEKDGEQLEIWSARDAVVLKCLEIVLKGRMLADSACSNCHHLKGRGGIKEAIGKVRRNLKNYKYVFRTDVKKYYASIDHDALFKMLEDYIGETPVLSLLYQFMKRTNYRNGYYKTVEKGICRGSSLSPLLGALFLKELDEVMEKCGCLYVRYIDDILILAKNKWSFRRIIKKVNRIFERLKLSQAKDKTYIGRIERGFDFLGFYFAPAGMSLSKKSVQKFAENIVLKLESHKALIAGNINPSSQAKYCESGGGYAAKRFSGKTVNGDLPIPETVSAYVRRWLIWVKSIYGKETTLCPTETC